MALTFLNDDTENVSSGQKLFLNDWLKENPKNKKTEHLVSELRPVQSNKGYILETDYFLGWIWKNAKVTKQLIEALEHWVSSPELGYALYLVQDGPLSSSFKLATDKEQPFTWYTRKNGFSVLGSDLSADISSQDTNPFL